GNPAPVRAAGSAVRVTSGVHQRTAIELGRDADVERDRLRRDDSRRPEGHSAVEGVVEGNGVGRDIVPGDIYLAVGTGGDGRADRVARTVRIVDPRGGEAEAAIARAGEPDSAARRPAARCVPGDIDAVAEGTAPI